MASNNFSHTSEFDTEQEAINMIQSQNKKIQDLFMEIERKEASLQNMQAQVNTMESYKIQMENFKRQVGILEEKLKLYEGEFSHKNVFLSEQLKIVSEAENKLRNQVIGKDKIIQELDSAIKDYEKQLSISRRQNVEKEKICEDIKQDFNEISQKFKNLQIKFNQKDEELRKYKDENEYNFTEMSKEKAHLEEKMSQLITIVKQYSNELADLNSQVGYLENERRSLAKANSKFKDEIEECYLKNKELSEQLVELRIVKNKLLEAENYLNDLENSFEKEKARNENLNRTNKDLNDKLNKIAERYSGENSLENLRNVINEKENEIYNLKQTLENLAKMSKAVDNKFCEVDAENKEILHGLNAEFKAICQWIETYLCTYFDSSFDIPDLPYTMSKYIKNKTKIDSVKEMLNKGRDRCNKEFYKYESNIKELKGEQADLLEKQEKLNYEISDLKTENLKKNEEIFRLKEALEDLNNNIAYGNDNMNKLQNDFQEKQENYFKFIEKLSNLIRSELQEIQGNDLLNPFFDFIFRKNFASNLDNLENQMEDNLEKLVQILNALIKEYENSQSKLDEIQKVKAENDKLRKDLIDKTKIFKDEIDRINKEREESLKYAEQKQIEELKNNESISKSAQEKMRNKLVEKDEANLQLQHENNLLRSQLEIMEKNINNYQNIRKESEFDLKDKYEKLSENYKQLEKKHKNLITEVELKDMQINSQEQMINRRTQEIQEYKSKLENHLVNTPGEIRDFEKEKFKQLEVSIEKFLFNRIVYFNLLMDKYYYNSTYLFNLKLFSLFFRLIRRSYLRIIFCL